MEYLYLRSNGFAVEVQASVNHTKGAKRFTVNEYKAIAFDG